MLRFCDMANPYLRVPDVSIVRTLAWLIATRRLANGKGCVEGSRDMWESGYSPVAERFFRGVCHRAVFLYGAQPPGMEGASMWGGWAATPPN